MELNEFRLAWWFCVSVDVYLFQAQNNKLFYFIAFFLCMIPFVGCASMMVQAEELIDKWTKEYKESKGVW